MTSTPSVKFEVAVPPRESRCQAWKFQASPFRAGDEAGGLRDLGQVDGQREGAGRAGVQDLARPHVAADGTAEAGLPWEPPGMGISDCCWLVRKKPKDEVGRFEASMESWLVLTDAEPSPRMTRTPVELTAPGPVVGADRAAGSLRDDQVVEVVEVVVVAPEEIRISLKNMSWTISSRSAVPVGYSVEGSRRAAGAPCPGGSRGAPRGARGPSRRYRRWSPGQARRALVVDAPLVRVPGDPMKSCSPVPCSISAKPPKCSPGCPEKLTRLKENQMVVLSMPKRPPAAMSGCRAASGLR